MKEATSKDTGTHLLGLYGNQMTKKIMDFKKNNAIHLGKMGNKEARKDKDEMEKLKTYQSSLHIYPHHLYFQM